MSSHFVVITSLILVTGCRSHSTSIMPKLVYSKIAEFVSEKALEEWKDANRLWWSCINTLRPKCTICKAVKRDGHQMVVRTMHCSNNDCNTDNIECAKVYRVNTCKRNGRVTLADNGRYHTGGKFEVVQRGLTKKVKELIDTMISTVSNQPKPVFVAMHRKKFQGMYEESAAQGR